MAAGREAGEAPYKAHTGFFVRLSLGCLGLSLGQREGAAPRKPTDGDALQGPGAGGTVCRHDLLTRVYPASWRLRARAGTHRHTHPQAPRGGTIWTPDLLPCA